MTIICLDYGGEGQSSQRRVELWAYVPVQCIHSFTHSFISFGMPIIGTSNQCQNTNELGWKTGPLLGVGHAQEAYEADGIGRTDLRLKPHCGN